ncbi:hypothetical protein GIB67_001304 [Kingdonia uniflora]|uniref:Uncharacterized protein n=1 Tax=Kingdonia uniflora TaxID=39325 RepID=A0A7J7LLE2_9MAGN|nr:hypothetical protein GIB67_001304 [Kingdonia uniflora]
MDEKVDLEDDFDELYADVEEMYLEVQVKKPHSCGASESKSESLGEKASGENEVVMGLDNGSDSEDELHIVLNEEDCNKYFVGSGRRNVGSSDGGEMEHCYDEDEDEKLAIVNEGERLVNDRVEQSSGLGVERGIGSKSGGYHSQYKYIRPHAAAFPSNAKNDGAGLAVPFSSSLSSRGDWDANYQAGNSGAVVSSSFTTFPVNSRNRCDFFLPRSSGQGQFGESAATRVTHLKTLVNNAVEVVKTM